MHLIKPKTFVLVGTLAFVITLASPLINPSLKAGAAPNPLGNYRTAKNFGASDGLAQLIVVVGVLVEKLELKKL